MYDLKREEEEVRIPSREIYTEKDPLASDNKLKKSEDNKMGFLFERYFIIGGGR